MLWTLLPLLAALCIGLDGLAASKPNMPVSRTVQRLGTRLQSINLSLTGALASFLAIYRSILDALSLKPLLFLAASASLSLGSFALFYSIAFWISPPSAIPNIFSYDADGWVVFSIFVVIINVIVDALSYKKTAFFVRLLTPPANEHTSSFPQSLSTYLRSITISFSDFSSSILLPLIIFSLAFAVSQAIFDFLFEQQRHTVYFVPQPIEQGNVPIFYTTLSKEYVPEGETLSITLEEDDEHRTRAYTISASGEMQDEFLRSSVYSPASGFLGFLFDPNYANTEHNKSIIDNVLEHRHDVICDFSYQGKLDDGRYEYLWSICQSETATISDRFFRNFSNLVAQLSWLFFSEGDYYPQLNPFLLTREPHAAWLHTNEGIASEEEVSGIIERAKSNAPFNPDIMFSDDAISLRENIARAKYQMDYLPIGSALLSGLVTSILFILAIPLALILWLTVMFGKAIAYIPERFYMPVGNWPLTFFFLLVFVPFSIGYLFLG